MGAFVAGLLALLCSFVACQNERLTVTLVPAPETSAPEEIYCTIGEELEEDTRTSLAGQVGVGEQPVSWTSGDKVSLFPECNDNHGYVTSDTGVVTATFVRSDDPVVPADVAESHAGVFYGIYPYQTDHKMAAGIATVTLPAEQSALTTMADPMAMIMTSKSETQDFHFRNNPSMIRFRLAQEGMDGLTIQKIRVSSPTAWLAGRGTIDIAATEPTLVITDDEATASHTVSLTPTDVVALQEGTNYTIFYLLIAAGTYEDLIVEFETSQGNFVSDLNGVTVNLQRGIILSMRRTFTPDEFTGVTENEKFEEAGPEIELN